MPEHHAPDEILIAYAAGSLGASESLLVACHLTLCPRCRKLVDDAEAVGAALLASGPASPAPGASLLDAMLARLDQDDAARDAGAGSGAATGAATGAGRERPAAPAVDPRGIVPAPLFRLIGDIDAAPWRRVMSGIYALDVPGVGDDRRAHMFRFDAGLRVPEHGHVGFEGTFVLSGGFTDEHGHFVRGDLSLLDPTRPHEQRIDPDGPCTWLVVADGKPIPRTLLGWLARFFLRV